MTTNLGISAQNFKPTRSFTSQRPNPVALMLENARLQNEIITLKSELISLYREKYQQPVNNLMISFRKEAAI